LDRSEWGKFRSEGFSSLVPGRDLNPKAVLGSQDEFAQQGEILAPVDGLDLVLPQHRGDHGLLLQNGKLLTDAVARSSAEGDVGEGMATGAVFRQEVVRIELLRLGENPRVAVEGVGHDDGLSSSGHDLTTCWNIS